jgi:hypothetical protein
MKICFGKTFITCATMALMLPVSYVCAQDKDTVVRSGEFADDVFVSGSDISVRADLKQDLFVMGDTVEVSSRVKGDVFASGGHLEFDSEIDGSFLAAGGKIELEGKIRESVIIFAANVDVDAEIEGDVLLTAGNVDVSGDVRGDLRGSAGKIEIHRVVHGNLLLGGGKVELRDGSNIKGKATIGAGRLYVGGHIERGLKAGAREIVIAGVIDGNVKLVANQITLLPSARIMGDLVYRSPQAIKLDDTSQISGDVTYIQSEEMRKGMGGLFAIAGATHLIVVVGMIIVAALVIFIAPPLFPTIEGRVRGQKWRALGLGLVFLIAMPIVMTLLTVTAIGFPLALLLSAMYFLVIATGLLGGSYTVGQKIFTLMKQDFHGSALKQIAASAVGLVLLGLITLVPVIGVVMFAIVTSLGIGALLTSGFRLCRGQSGALEAA